MKEKDWRKKEKGVLLSTTMARSVKYASTTPRRLAMMPHTPKTMEIIASSFTAEMSNSSCQQVIAEGEAGMGNEASLNG